MPRDEAEAIVRCERFLPVKPGDPTGAATGEHAVAGESTLSVAASAIEGTAFSFPSIIIKKAAKGIGNLGHVLLRVISYHSILIDASIAVEPTIVLTLLLVLTLLVKAVAMKSGALKPTAVETASSKASAVVGSTLSRGAGTSVKIGRHFLTF
jgi:hypothetical protein